MTHALCRREFLKVSAALGGGLALELRFPLATAAGTLTEVNAWVVIQPDDRVVIRVARSEMGQGSYTALAQLVAEELDCDWNRVSAEFASPNEHIRRNRVWGSMSTGGSQGIRSSQEYLRKAGASARGMLVAAAAQQWKVPAAECTVDKGIITHGPTRRKLRYGQVATAASKLAPPNDVVLRDPARWKIAGQPVHRLDIPDKVRGKPVFGVDVSLPGMLHASIAQCPVFGGKVSSVDDGAALAMRGVKKVVREEDFVAVVADNWWRANQALKQVKVEWDYGGKDKLDNDTIMTMFREGLAAADLPQARRIGDTQAAFGSAAKLIEAEYSSPYLYHATMEPQTCTAWLKPEGFLDVWTSTQNAESSMAVASQTAGLPLEKVEVHKMMLGGGFGRRGAAQDFVRQGVLIAKQMPGVPVKLMWSREEDMQHGFYRPASLVRIKAGLDAQGNLVAMHTRIACPSILRVLLPDTPIKDGIDFSAVRSFNDVPYTVANQQVDYAMRNGHVPVGFWRAPGQQNAFYRECFIDELAGAAGKDPVEYRLAMLKAGDKNRGVLEAVVKAASWGSPLPTGVYRGVAVADGFGSYSAMVVELSVTGEGELKVHRVVVAVDSGYVVNPDTCRAQAESNVVYGLGTITGQEINIRDGHVVESNFHDFPLPHIADAPKVETVLVPTGGFWGGHGEPVILPLQPAVCNAIFAATGKRVRSLPLKSQDLRRT
ncbi:MAG TPA: molybdopterin cofactor-binding domain-containing protein [Casimicrobiaceae bacterium]|nr:molybdopterin cofactor-binding domain-containing protein [Casimicrobiaceae bacterium]